MFRTVALLFFAGQFLFIKSQYSQRDYEEQIQDDILTRISEVTLVVCRLMPSENSEYPALRAHVFSEMRKSDIEFDPSSSAWASILDEFAQTSNAQVKFMNIVIYDQDYPRKQYVDVLKQYFHAEAYEISFGVGSNEDILLCDEWERRTGKVQHYSYSGLSGKPIIIASTSSFTSCWDTPKTCANSIKELKFKTPSGEIDIEAFNAKDTIGYYNNAEQKYEAIRVPYKQGEFAMIVVLPYQNQSLESIGKFTINDHKQILQRVGENHENIDYLIPFIKLTEMSVNENGTSIDAADEIICNWTSAQKTREVDKIDYKPFHVNRPFAVYIYHERTKLVFMHALINNPPLGTQKFSKVLPGKMPRNITMAT